MTNDAKDESADFLNDVKLTPNAIELLDNLLDAAPPHVLRENLLEIYHTYLIHAGNTLPIDFDRLAMNMYHFINCLGTLQRDNPKS
jgi:hypothetical protein